MNRINIVCLGVKDINKSLAFYRSLGFSTNEQGSNPPVVFFNSTGTKLELYPLDALAADAGAAEAPKSGFCGIVLAYNVPNKEGVKDTIERAREAGARILKEPQDAFWGGYHAYFADPDGYCWEAAWGPDFAYDKNGMLIF